MTQTPSVPDNFPDPFHTTISSAPFQTHDLTATKGLLDQINVSAGAVSKSLSSAFANAATSGKSFNDTLTTIAESLAKLALRAGTRSLLEGISSGFGSLFSGLFSGSGANAIVAPFADGGVVASPTFFGAGSSIGLMGERGAEAIMPLARGPDGRLGVAMQGQPSPVAVTVNIAAQDVDSFKRSEAQITAALARAVARGQRNL
ncbi:MAG: phage tail tape measure protein [Methylocystis sp.]|nr:phage tail tape measure protein [Methylocystis sp.]